MSGNSRQYAGIEVPAGVTKSAFKRQLKQQRLEASRPEFLEKRRLKRREAHRKQALRRAVRQPTPDAQPAGVGVVIDCGFDELMVDNELVSLAGQLTRCYSENKHAKRPVDLTISGFNGRLRDRFETALHRTHEHWHNVKFTASDYDADPQSVVYLTGDSDNVLEELEEGKSYVIGGIVDHNRYKNLCLDKAAETGLTAARLPIDEHIRVSGRRVLTTNQAFELVLRWLELRDWKAAFEAVIPPRKLRKSTDSSEESPVPTTPLNPTASPSNPSNAEQRPLDGGDVSGEGTPT